MGALVVEGVREGLWELANSTDAPAMFQRYDARVAEDARRDTYDRLLASPPPQGLQVEVAGGIGRIESDYASPEALPVGSVALRTPVIGGLSLGGGGRAGFVDTGLENRYYLGGEASARAVMFPSARVSPFVTFGGGVLGVPENPSSFDIFPYATASGGIEARVSRSVAIWADASNVYPFREGLDGLNGGAGVHDNVWTLRAGLLFYGL